MKKSLLLTCLLSRGAALLVAGPQAVLVPPPQTVAPGELVSLTLYLNNPTNNRVSFSVPRQWRAELAANGTRRDLLLKLEGSSVAPEVPVDPKDFRQFVLTFAIPPDVQGAVALRLIEPSANEVMFRVAGTSLATAQKESAPVMPAASDSVSSHSSRIANLDLETDWEAIRGHVSPLDPVYFSVGFNTGANARFQFSFKYQLFATTAARLSRWQDDLYFGFTQTSLWDLHSFSKPFRDSSYKPALFYYRQRLRDDDSWLSRVGLYAGFQHESNGKAGLDSRSLNSLYFTPVITLVRHEGFFWTVGPQGFYYVDKSENPDITDYRGHVDIHMTLGWGNGLQLTTLLRKGDQSGYGSGELDLSYPLRKVWLFSDTAGGYLHIQYFNGWGETILDYNHRFHDELRFGIMLAR